MTFTPTAGGGHLNGRSGAGDGDDFSAVFEDPLGRSEDPLNWSVWDSLWVWGPVDR